LSPELIALVFNWGPAILMVLLLYFLLLRPQKKEHQRRLLMLENLKTGDRVVTIGGLYGKIAALDDRTIKLIVAPGVEIEVARFAVNANITQDGITSS